MTAIAPLIPDSPLEPRMRLSQGHLNALATCPRQFQHLFLEQLSVPTTPEQQERLDWGSRFHLLMQQRELGLPLMPLAEESADLYRCFTGFVSQAEELFGDRDSSNAWRQSEHRRTLELQNYLITVIYDLVILEDDQAQILDWKTYPRPQCRDRLAQNWQTRLYPYVLAETSSYAPAQISLTYWFVQVSEPEGVPQSWQFCYSDDEHRQTQEALTQLLSQLTQWLGDYQAGIDFPQVPENLGHCQHCHFAVRCQRHERTEREIPGDRFDLAVIPEIPL